MANPVVKPARRPSALAQAAVDLGAVPVVDEPADYPDFPEEDTMDSPAMFTSETTEYPAPSSETIQIHGVYDGFPVVYTTAVSIDGGDFNIILAELTQILREAGIGPQAQATIAAPAAPQNSGASRDVWNDGSKAAAAAPAAGWQTCGHGARYVKADTSYGGERCTYSQQEFFPGSRHWVSRDDPNKQAFYCKVNSRGGGQ